MAAQCCSVRVQISSEYYTKEAQNQWPAMKPVAGRKDGSPCITVLTDASTTDLVAYQLQP